MKVDLLNDIGYIYELEYDVTNDLFEFKKTRGSFQRGYSDEIKLDSEDYELNEGDKLFFYKGCNILRDKIRSYSDANNNCISITIKPENADVRFVGVDTVSKIVSNDSTGYSSDRMEIISLMQSAKNTDYDGVIQELLNCDDDEIFVEWEAIHKMRDLKQKVDPDDYFEYNYKYIYRIKNEEMFDEMKEFSDNGGKFYNDASLLKTINGSLDALDQDAFDQIELMLMSSDSGDIRLAAEMMANSDPVKSGYHLAYLLTTYDGKLRGGNGIWNSVNFKSMRECFPDFQYKDKLDTIVYACENELVTDDNLELVKRHTNECFESLLDHRLKKLLVIQKKSLGEVVINSVKKNRVKDGVTQNLVSEES